MIKLLIADDHVMIREGLKQILAENEDLVVAGEAGDGMEVLQKVTQQNYDVVLLDIQMPRRSGLEIIKDIRKLKPETKILILSMYSEELYAFRAIKAGASGYLTKNHCPSELISAIRKVSTGRKYISQAVAEQLANGLQKDGEALHQKLSNREYQVMCLIALGKTVTEISNELALSVSTISTLRSRILQKTGLKNNAQITYYAIKNSLVV